MQEWSHTPGAHRHQHQRRRRAGARDAIPAPSGWPVLARGPGSSYGDMLSQAGSARMWWVYVVHRASRRYTSVATRLLARQRAHNADNQRGAGYTCPGSREHAGDRHDRRVAGAHDDGVQGQVAATSLLPGPSRRAAGASAVGLAEYVVAEGTARPLTARPAAHPGERFAAWHGKPTSGFQIFIWAPMGTPCPAGRSVLIVRHHCRSPRAG